MSWQDIEDCLFDGNEKEINELKCPVCGEHINWTFLDTAKTLKYGCSKCNTYSSLSKVAGVPNCANINN